MRVNENHLPSLGREILSKELRKSKNMIDSFSYSCSHGIGSPLKSLKGLIMLMKREPVRRGDDWQQYFIQLKNSVQQLEQVILQFKELEFITNRKPKPEVIDLNSLFNGILSSLEPRVENSKVTVSFHLRQKGVFHADSKRMHMIFARIIENAITFTDMKKEENRVNILVTASPAGGSFQVVDNGHGVATNDQSRVFSPFFRGSVQSSGIGMGLFIVKQVVEKMGGTIAIKSAEGVGSNFSVWLPNMCTTGAN